MCMNTLEEIEQEFDRVAFKKTIARKTARKKVIKWTLCFFLLGAFCFVFILSYLIKTTAKNRF